MADDVIWESEENINQSVVDQEVLDLYNQGMATLASRICQEFSPLQSRTKTTWETTSEMIKKEVKENVLQGCQIVCKVVAPNSCKEVYDSLFSDKAEDTDSISEELVSLMTAYRDAPSKNVKLQILSLYASRFPAEKLIKYHEPYEKITHWQIKQARSHARKYGPGVPEQKTLHHRVRLPMDKVDHFIDFIDRPYFYQDVAYGTRVLKLDSGAEVSMPNVVRNVTRSTMVHQYLQYCNEEQFLPLCQRTLFKILEVREASQRKSLQGLDNTAADGAVGFESLEKIVDDLESLGASKTWCCETKKLLNECKRYLKTDYRVQCQDSHSCCPDHCRDYALSDEKDKAFRVTCNHTHDVQCDQCDSLDSVLKDVEKQIKNPSISLYSDDQQEDLLHDWKKSKESIYNWKSHILRSINQESAKQNVLRNLKPNEALIIFDWAMKFQQMKFREKQSDWYGKRGLSWHISTIVLKPEESSKDVEVRTYAHLFDKCTQDWYAVLSIIEDLLVWLKSNIPSISHVFLRSDEAGCYHNNFLVAALHGISERTGVTVKRFDHSEPQDGKDMCDRILCPMKTAVRTFCNEGHDISNASDIRIALLERPVKGVSAAVCSVQESNKTLKVNKLDGFSKYHNFAFEKEGVRIWKCYGIGSGKLVSYKSLTQVSQEATSLQVEQPFFNISQSRALKSKAENPSDSKETSLNLLCPEPGCEKLFATFADLELHVDVGDHDEKEGKETVSVYDTIRKRWATRFTTIQIERNKTKLQSSSTLETCTQDQGTANKVAQGWALHKVRGGGTQFSQNVRDYLTSKFDLGEKTGQKCDADQVAKDMRNAKTVDNQRMFKRDEWLTKTQIKGFFSRLASSRRKGTSVDATSSVEDEEDEINEQEHYEVIEEVLEELGVKHPIVYDVYNLCRYYEDDSLSSFNVSMLRDICRHFDIPFKSRDLKRVLLEKVAAMVKECSCCK